MIGKYELNKIYNEDSYEAIKNIPDNSVDLIIIDPPYLIENTNGGMNNGLGKSNDRNVYIRHIMEYVEMG